MQDTPKETVPLSLGAVLSKNQENTSHAPHSLFQRVVSSFANIKIHIQSHQSISLKFGGIQVFLKVLEAYEESDFISLNTDSP